MSLAAAADPALAALAAAACCLALTVLWRRVALAGGFVDTPHGYKRHLAPTPYMGGIAVLTAASVATLLFADVPRQLAVVLALAVLLAAVGTLDDRLGVAPKWRLAVELVAAYVLWRNGVHWTAFGIAPLDFALTAVWVVGIVNAFNLMDNIDGAAATVIAASGLAAGCLALVQHQPAFAVAGFAVAGACAGFLPHNLARPARIFLGDGGSMPLGFLVAALSMATAGTSAALGPAAVLGGALIAGLPILDTSLVVFSRRRRGLSIVTAGRDHLNHRLLGHLRSERRVALMLAVGQLCLGALGVAGARLGVMFALPVAIVATVLGLATIAYLEATSPPVAVESAPAPRRRAAAAPLAAPGVVAAAGTRFRRAGLQPAADEELSRTL